MMMIGSFAVTLENLRTFRVISTLIFPDCSHKFLSLYWVSRTCQVTDYIVFDCIRKSVDENCTFCCFPALVLCYFSTVLFVCLIILLTYLLHHMVPGGY